MAKILIIEDDSFLVDIYSEKLRQEGFEVDTAINGEEGIALAMESPPDVMLLDMVLPQKSGLEVLEALKKNSRTKDIPVIAFSNLGEKEDVENALRLGAAGYIVKSQFTPSEVVKKVKEFLQ